MLDICTIGHISLDKVVTTQSIKYMPGGTAFYFSKALLEADVAYRLVTALAAEEYAVLDELRAEGIDVHTLPSQHTVYFENIYSEDQNHRDQNVLHQAASFSIAQMPKLEAKLFHLGPLLADDIPVELIEYLAQKGQVSLDVQGYLRHVRNKKVVYQDWPAKTAALANVTILKANELEMEVVTGQKDPYEGARYLADLGVAEVIITLGSQGSLIYTGGTFHQVRAFTPTAVVDATGCGDTYMAGYLTKRVKGAPVEEAGEWGAAMASQKIGSFGPFRASSVQVAKMLEQSIY